VAGVTGDCGEPQLGPLPLVLIADLGGGNLIPAPSPVEDGLDESPLLFQRVAGREVESDVEVPYVRGISRSS